MRLKDRVIIVTGSAQGIGRAYASRLSEEGAKVVIADVLDPKPTADEILATIGNQGTTTVTMHDGSVLRFTAVPADYDPTDRRKVFDYLQRNTGEIATGILYVDESMPDMHEMNNTPAVPLGRVPFDKLCPGADALNALQEEYR
jgi:2-oxoglutarate ferredoxin oxidoreductase subunit beta